MFVDSHLHPRGARSAVKPAPQAFDHNPVQRLVARTQPGLAASKSPPGGDGFERVAARKTIALDRPSVFLLLRGSIFVGGGRHRKGIQHFLRHVTCLEGRVLAGSQIRTVLLSQWVPWRHCRTRRLRATLCNAAGHAGAQQTEHKTDTAVVSRMVRCAARRQTGAARPKECADRDARRRPEARIDT